MVHIVKECLNQKCKSQNIRYDDEKNTLHCDKCEFKWKVKPYTPPVKCRECKSHDIIYTEDEIYCNNCGLVLSTSIKYSAGDIIDLPWGLLL